MEIIRGCSRYQSGSFGGCAIFYPDTHPLPWAFGRLGCVPRIIPDRFCQAERFPIASHAIEVAGWSLVEIFGMSRVLSSRSRATRQSTNRPDQSPAHRAAYTYQCAVVPPPHDSIYARLISDAGVGAGILPEKEKKREKEKEKDETSRLKIAG